MTAQATRTMLRARGSAWGDREAAAEYQKLKDALNKEAEANWDKEEWHREQAATLASYLDYQFTFTNLFGDYFRTRTVGEFEKVWLRERRGLKVFYTHRGGYIEESQLRTEDWELPRDTMGFHVSEHEDKLRSGFADTMEDMVGLAEQRWTAEANRRMFNLLQEAIPSSSPYYVAAGSITKPVIDTALREVRDAIKPNGAGPTPVTIIGRAAVVDQVSDLATVGTGVFAPDATQRVLNEGRIGIYRGAQVVQVTNYTDENGESYIPDNELWVFGGDVGLFVQYGGIKAKTWAENTVDYRHYRGRADIGGLIHHPEQARRIVVP